ncbi:hypothetical protein L486_01094 [Kwoniella mangroviensis CBS 10435]|uniref:Myo-inositol 2-dehydrogenase n=1 Tax=Kwoniella mangroviensis CBS 10435 TaxID=1331196 RepID=A0A1B9J0Y7_9TREE|nr:hypothetical protein L486_01094 [Kwoniella mangroviensis CBS 10435]
MPIATSNIPAILDVGVIGLGRMGQRHANNVAFATPRARLVAACDLQKDNVTWAKKALPSSTKVYGDEDAFFNHERLDAVLIATETSTHAPLALKALQYGKHVLVEKPISVDQHTAEQFELQAREFPYLKVMVGFSRRFDQSYQEAKQLIDSGVVGKPFLVKSSTNDQYDPSGFFIAYSAKSGGIFMDCGIHDIDMARHLLEITPADRVKRVFASGTNVRHPELADSGDADNALGFVEYESGKSFTFHLSRTAIHGHDCACEVHGEEAKLIVNQNPRLNRLELADQYGVRSLSTPTYYERFREAFVTEVNEFVACVLDDKPVPSTIHDAIEAGSIAQALTYSFRQGKPILFDQDNKAILA